MTATYWMKDGAYCLSGTGYALCDACPGGAADDCCSSPATPDKYPASVFVTVDGLTGTCHRLDEPEGAFNYDCTLLNTTFEVPFCRISAGTNVVFRADVSDTGFLCGNGITTFMYLFVILICAPGGDLTVHVKFIGDQEEAWPCSEKSGVKGGTGEMSFLGTIEQTGGLSCSEMLANPISVPYFGGLVLDQCMGEDPPVVVVTGCSGLTFRSCSCMPSTLTATITASSCADIDGQEVTLTWNGSSYYNGRILLGCGQYLEITIDEIADTVISITNAGRTTTYYSGSNPVGAVDCSPFYFSEGFTLNQGIGGACCGTDPETATLVITL